MYKLTMDKWMEVLPELLNEESSRSVSKLSQKLNITYSHITASILPLLIEQGLVTKTFIGRSNKLVLTKKGREIAMLIRTIKIRMEMN